MLNVTFSDSLSGCLKMADYYAKESNYEIQDLKENLFSLYLNLDLGDISEQTFGEKRENDFIKMFGNEDISFMRKWFNSELKKIDKIEKLVKKGHDIRIWYTERTNEFCGFCWLLSILDIWGVENNKILYVKLPQSILFDNGRYETFAGSGMFDPELLTQLAMTQRYLTNSYKNYHIRQWQRVQEENAQMRVSINNQLLSVSADFYDSIIISEIGKLGDTFKQAEAIGNCLAKLWVYDSFVAWRIDKMIEKGLFEIVKEAKTGSQYYCRTLRKNIKGENLMENTKDDKRIIEVYDAYIEQCTNEPEAFLDATNGITYYAKKNYWLILETIDHFIRIGYDGINFFKKDNVFLNSLDYMKPCVYTYEGEEHDEYIRTLFCGERLKNTYEKKGHYYAEFDSFSIEIIPYEDNEELPQIDRKDFSSYKNLYGCERFITKKCKCGGVGKLLLKFDYIYVVRCDKCKSATNIAFTANEAIESWESGNIPEDLSDIVIE